MSKKIIFFVIVYFYSVGGLLFHFNTIAQTRFDTITYHIFIRLDSTSGSCGYIEDFWPNINLPAYSFEGVAWTSGGYFYIGRSLLKYNLSFIPATALVSNAKLSLYHNPNPDPPGGHAGSNSCLLQRVTSNWDEYSVTWNNQPTTTNLNQIILPASTSSTQDYLNLDVTSFVSGWVASPGTNFGLFIKLQTEQVYRNLDFASGHCPDTTKRPRLEITYSVLTGINPVSNEIPDKFLLYQNYPNPFNPTTKIKFSLAKDSYVTLNVYDILGRIVQTLINLEHLKEGNYEVSFDGTNLASGLYFYEIIAGDFIKTKQMILIK